MSKSKPDISELIPEEGTPRFVLSLTDTQTVVGDQYFSVSIGDDKLSSFNRLLPKKMRTNTVRTEYQAMFAFFTKAIKDLDKEPYEKIPTPEFMKKDNGVVEGENETKAE